MKSYLLLIFAFAFVLKTGAQDFISVTNGASYAQQAFYRLSDDATTNIDNAAWDIAFTTVGLQDAGILVNESSKTSFAAPQPDVEVYAAETNVWGDVTDTSAIGERLYNNEIDWLYGGAFNSSRSPSDPFDFGWGKYNFMTNQVTGDKVFVIRLRDRSYKKFQIQNIILKTYTFRYANLDGSNEVVKTLNKDDHDGSPLAYFSFASGDFITSVQKDWDLLFCRYITPIEDNTGAFIPFPVTGTLSGFGVKVAEARGIDPSTVKYEDYADSLSTVLDVIGYDWKEFANNSEWVLAPDLVYFVKTTDGKVWKITFLAFGGSTTGEIVFEKTDVTPVSSVSENSNIQSFGISPNPAQNQTTMFFDLTESVQALNVAIFDQQGRTLRTYQFKPARGLNAIQLNELPAEAGLYFVRVTDGKSALTQKLLVR
ncbi:MAG TPA: T9SS type A sorting domain-containing protein [Saprospiraceae bacterium]|nr:T9SS type A sorting domain-containing protein [Saprospiraceae bacterium]